MSTRRPYESERDACGIGFVADSHGRGSRALVEVAIDALSRVKHRGAVAADALSGDGAGLLLPLPVAILAADTGVAEERLGAAMIFADGSDPGPGRRVVEDACAAEDLEFVAWRIVPTDESALGEKARASRPAIEQAIVLRPLGIDPEEGERRAFRARRRIQQRARSERVALYVASLSFRTITYKGLVAADRLASFYPDLADARYDAWFALFHQRFATNTTPTWERAQPFRFLAHNGEINTIRGNVAAMRSREGRLGSADLAAEDLLRPIVDIRGSDSAILDEALELLARGAATFVTPRPCSSPRRGVMWPAWMQTYALSSAITPVSSSLGMVPRESSSQTASELLPRSIATGSVLCVYRSARTVSSRAPRRVERFKREVTDASVA